MKFCKILFLLAFSLTACSVCLAAEHEITAKAQSNGTKADGTRDSDHSEVQKISLSQGEYFNPADPNVYSVNWLAQRGETDYEVTWHSYKEPFPGLSLPTEVHFRTHTRSPKVPPLSNIGVKGVAEAKLKIKSVKIP